MKYEYDVPLGFNVPADVEEVARKCREVVYDASTNSLICADNGVVLSLGAPTLEYSKSLTTTSQFTGGEYGAGERRDLARALVLYAEGVPVKEIMKRTGIKSLSTLYSVVRASGIKRRRKGFHKGLTHEMIKEIIRRWRAGESIYSLAKEYGVSTSTVHRLVGKYGRDASVFADIRRDVIRLYRKGLPIKEIMKRLGVKSVKEIYRIIKEAGVSTRRKKSKHRKLTRNDVSEIIRKYREGRSIYSLAKEYGVSTSTIYRIVKARKKKTRKKGVKS